MDSTTQQVRSASDEQEPLIRRTASIKTLLKRFLTARKCFGSPAILTLLAISFLAQLLFHFFSNPSHLLPDYFTNYNKYSNLNHHLPILMNNVAKTTCTTALLLLYPIAGYLADTRLGHYRTIVVSLRILIPSLLATLIGGIIVVVFTIIMPQVNIAHTPMIIAGAVTFSAGLIPLILAVVGIGANIVQLGLDQLFDAPWDDQMVFIYWYMWIAYTARLTIASLDIVYCVSANQKQYYIAAGSIFLIIALAMTILLVLATVMKRSFVTDYYRSRQNPYHQIYQVSRYAWRHKMLINNEAFSWCRNDIPSKLDIASQKFGGPFTTELVKDVKTFYGIVKVLLVSGLFFFFTHVTYDTIEAFKIHINHEIKVNLSSNTSTADLCPLTATEAISNRFLPKMFIVALLPCQILLIRPLFKHYFPGMFKTMGIVMTLNLLPMLSMLLLDTLAHSENKQLRCMFSPFHPTREYTLSSFRIAHTIAKYFHPYNIITTTFTDYLSVLMYVHLYKFICSQSPHSTKGFLVGLLFATSGFYDLMNPILALLLGKTWKKRNFPSCGMTYYLINIVLGLAAVLLYIDTARRHKYHRRGSESPLEVSHNVEDH